MKLLEEEHIIRFQLSCVSNLLHDARLMLRIYWSVFDVKKLKTDVYSNFYKLIQEDKLSYKEAITLLNKDIRRYKNLMKDLSYRLVCLRNPDKIQINLYDIGNKSVDKAAKEVKGLIQTLYNGRRFMFNYYKDRSNPKNLILFKVCSRGRCFTITPFTDLTDIITDMVILGCFSSTNGYLIQFPIMHYLSH